MAYNIPTFHEVVEDYLNGNTSVVVLTENEVKTHKDVSYKDLVSHRSAEDMFLIALEPEDEEDEEFVCYFRGHRIEIQESDGGWDYTYYHTDGSEWDGGIIDDCEASLLTVLNDVIASISSSEDCEAFRCL